MELDPAAPILVGGARFTRRLKNVAGESREETLRRMRELEDPIQMMQHAVLDAAADTGLEPDGAAALLRDAEGWFTNNVGPIGLWVMAGGDGSHANVFPNPPASLAKRNGAAAQHNNLWSMLGSGSGPQFLINNAADKIANAELNIVVVSGAEFLDTLAKAEAQKISVAELGWGDDVDGSRPNKVSLPKFSVHKAIKQETRHGLTAPIHFYPLFEQALRHSRKLSFQEHQERISRMWAGFSRVASAEENAKHSWFPRAWTTKDIAEPSTSNRFVTYPYTKLHCSVLTVDMAAAVILTSVGEATRRGIPRDRWVYLHGAADAEERGVLERPELHRSPALREAGRSALAQAGARAADMKHLDIYSCFPSAVGVAVEELGLPQDLLEDGERLTVTGGLPFHGGPGANYAMHSVVAMMDRLRTTGRGEFGMVTANGGYLSKHAVGIYSTAPPGRAWRREDSKLVQDRVLAYPTRQLSEGPEGAGLCESYTVLHDRSNRPTKAIMVGSVLSGRDVGKRFLAASTDQAVMTYLMQVDALGARVNLSTDSRGVTHFSPEGFEAKRSNL